MFKRMLLVPAVALALAGVVAPHAGAAARDYGDCMDIAVGENDADPWIADDACSSKELTTCYRIFRDEYGRQQWALDACKARNS
ncbi:hypothetical protein AB0A74_32875 [Saccharothrix sp. NPDC042600]|uniref:hypothetical protein n=1 Tax=Saccharothrix TaxID=2071 RepID=UPI0033E99C2C|nr:hypothetical protein GCM10017745_40820 [Saccharothrix mutabilis subsp. capreolus]